MSGGEGSRIATRHVQLVDELLLFGGDFAGKGGERKRDGRDDDHSSEAAKRQTKPA